MFSTMKHIDRHYIVRNIQDKQCSRQTKLVIFAMPILEAVYSTLNLRDCFLQIFRRLGKRFWLPNASIQATNWRARKSPTFFVTTICFNPAR